MCERIPATAAILAGGKSTRMGTDKALLRLEGKSLVVRQVELLHAAFDSVLVVTNSDATRQALAGVRTVSDLLADQGPIGGLHAALKAATTEWTFVVGCDMPFVSLDLARHLYELREGYDLVAPLSEELIETMHTLYSERCVEAIERQIARGQRKLIRFFDDLRVLRVPVGVSRRFDENLRMFMNVNTPDEYEALKSIL